jgi:hypothetical protein
MDKEFYVNSNELEEWWAGWNITGCEYAWEQMSSMISKICFGVARKFNPRDEDEYYEHVHDALVQTLEKIHSGKLKFKHGQAPVFNLLTTTIFRILYSKMNKQKRTKEHLANYTQLFLQDVRRKHPEQLLSNS